VILKLANKVLEINGEKRREIDEFLKDKED